MKLFTKQNIGKRGERIAARYLKKQGFRVVGRNLHFGKNELDLVAKSKTVLAFVEVKTRSYERVEDAELSRPALAVDHDKRIRTAKAAKAYLRAH
ncbi:MAG: YraN family protein, partial [Clostridia bacterium]|nr:YraN family protein [Clostridia bacterium]